MRKLILFIAITLSAIIFTSCNKEEQTPNDPDKIAIAVGDIVPDDIKNFPSKYGFINMQYESYYLDFGYEQGYSVNTWQFKSVRERGICPYVNYDRMIAFDNGSNRIFRQIATQFSTVSSPDGKRLWSIIGYTYDSPDYGIVLIPTYNGGTASYNIQSESYEKPNSDWEKRILATYHYVGNSLVTSPDFTGNVTVKYKASTNKYWMYEPYFHPESNGGLGLAFEVHSGYNSTWVYGGAKKAPDGNWYTYDVYCKFTITD